jgi:predicted nucleotidyltransferase
MQTLSDYTSLLRDYMRDNAIRYGITRMGIFGSVARNEQTEASDVDICFESDHISLFSLCCLKSELEKLLGRNVDLMRMRKTIKNKHLQQSIMKDLIYV